MYLYSLSFVSTFPQMERNRIKVSTIIVVRCEM